ncbi:MAG: N-acetylgalactosamine-6-sulfatase, partial [Opitutaceae bacterium]
MKIPLLPVLAFSLALPASSAPVTAASAPRPNVVIFLVDDMGVMDTSVPFLTDAAGRPQRHPLNAYYRTPNMERLASRGV